MCWAESTCTGLLKYSPQSPGNCSCLRSSASFLVSVSRQCVFQFLSSFCLFLVLFLVRLTLFSTSFLNPPLPPFPHISLPTLSPLLPLLLPSSIFNLHYHSPHPHLSVPLLSPVRLEHRITEIPSRLSWIGYADVTDTTAPYKYTAYYLPSLQHTHKASRSSRLTSRLHRVHGIYATCAAFCVTPQQIYANHIFSSPVLDLIPAHEKTVCNCCFQLRLIFS